MFISDNKKYVLMWLTFTLTLAQEKTLQRFVSANNAFSASVYEVILKNNSGNVVVSPFLAERFILVLIQSEPKGETAAEILKCLHLPSDKENISKDFHSVHSALLNNENLLRSVNQLMTGREFHITYEFERIASENLSVVIQNIDFARRVGTNVINRWLKYQTEDTMPDLINSEIFDDETKRVFLNVLYFRGEWSQPFKSSLTKKEDFHKLNGDVIKVDTMHDNSYYNYFENWVCKFLEIPLKEKEASVTIILPNTKIGLVGLKDHIKKVFSEPKYSLELVNVALPKFKLKSQVDLKQILKRLGVEKIFEQGEVPLSGVFGKREEFYLDQFLQTSFINLNETGVEAGAAASAEDTSTRINGSFVNSPKQFIANRPFIFLVKYNGFVIFAGSVLEPSY